MTYFHPNKTNQSNALGRILEGGPCPLLGRQGNLVRNGCFKCAGVVVRTRAVSILGHRYPARL